MSVRHVVVVIPARDEEETIEACLASVDHARRHLPVEVTSGCVVVLDSCRDRTVDRVRVRASTVDAVEVEVGCVGAARRIGVARALKGATVRPEQLWIASTDADTVVGPTWLLDQLDIAARGIVAVAGTVALPETTSPAILRAFARHYVVDAGGHRHVHGCNLGMRGDAYRAAGGWSVRATGEDHDLWGRLGRVGVVESRAELRVVTSARTTGRAVQGFADDVRALRRGAA